MNAKTEFLNFIGNKPVKCAQVGHTSNWEDATLDKILRLNFTASDWYSFVRSLDFEYDSGYGSQKLFGTIWFCDGSWATRGEYDGSEWWETQSLPEIPAELISDSAQPQPPAQTPAE